MVDYYDGDWNYYDFVEKVNIERLNPAGVAVSLVTNVDAIVYGESVDPMGGLAGGDAKTRSIRLRKSQMSSNIIAGNDVIVRVSDSVRYTVKNANLEQLEHDFLCTCVREV